MIHLEQQKGSNKPQQTYKEFVEKFKPKKTTDDCYTPPLVYEAVRSWAVKEYGWEGREIVRPFYPGGDYENYDYPEDCVVIDNPPFSTISQIARFFNEKGIDYFLFAPHLTLFSIRYARSHVVVGADIIYENGAKVNTSFIASQGATIRTSPDLYNLLEQAVEEGKIKKELPKYTYPGSVACIGVLGEMPKYGVKYEEDNAYFIRTLDEQRKHKKSIFGSGYLVPADPLTRAKEAHEAQKALAHEAQVRKVWELSPREIEVIEELESSC